MTLSREYLVQSVGSCPGWEVNQARYLTLLRTLHLLAVSFEKPRWTNKNLIDKQKGQKSDQCMLQSSMCSIFYVVHSKVHLHASDPN
jgi:hypothetical protein